MNLLSILNKEELRNFKLSLRKIYLNQTDNPLSTIADAFKKDSNLNEDEIYSKYFTYLTKNAFYQLKHKLNDEIYKSLLTLNFKKDDKTKILNAYIIARILSFKSEFNLALKHLKTAVKSAEKIESYELLIMLYDEILRLSYYCFEVNVPEIVKNKRIVIEKYSEANKIQELLIEYNWYLNNSKFESDVNSFLKQLNAIENKITQIKDLKKSTSLQIQLQKAVRNNLLQKKEFNKLSSYLEDRLAYFKELNIFNKNNHSDKLSMLIWLANAYIFQKDIDKVFEINESLEKNLNLYNRIYFNNFYWSLIQNKLYCNFYTNNLKEALNVALEAKESKLVKHYVPFSTSISVNIAIFNLCMKKYKVGHDYLTFLEDKEKVRPMEKSFLLGCSILNTIFYYEKNDFEFTIYKLNEIKRKFKTYLQEEQNQKYKTFIKFTYYLAKYHGNIPNKKFEKDIYAYINYQNSNQNSVYELINYRLWLKSKLEKIDYYQTILNENN